MTTSGVLAVAAADVTSIGSSLGQAHAAAAASTTVMIAAAEDEVSAAIASLFSDYGQQYQALSARAAAFMPSLCRR
jgi:16S rRNA G1207 methylase RsmC